MGTACDLIYLQINYHLRPLKNIYVELLNISILFNFTNN